MLAAGEAECCWVGKATRFVRREPAAAVVAVADAASVKPNSGGSFQARSKLPGAIGTSGTGTPVPAAAAPGGLLCSVILSSFFLYVSVLSPPISGYSAG